VHSRGDAAAAESAVRFICVTVSSAGFADGKLRLIPACGPNANLPEERSIFRKQGRRRVGLRELISAVGTDVAEKTRRERLLHHLEFSEQSTPAGTRNVQPGTSGSACSELESKQ